MTVALNIPLIEKALLTGSWPQDFQYDASVYPVLEIAQDVVNGRFRAPLTSPAARELFQLGPNVNEQPFDSLLGLCQVPEKALDEAGELLRLSLAVALLHAFLQTNWTGPDIDVKPLEILTAPPEIASSLTDAALDQKATAELAYGGEPSYHLARFPVFLRLAQLLLQQSYRFCASAAWWKLRAEITHQQLLDEPVVPPPSVFTALETLTGTYASDPDLLGRLHLETGLLHHITTQDKSAAEYFVRAARATGLEYELTGALGKRTKFQQKDLSQLVLLAESRLKIEDRSEKDAQNSTELVDTQNAAEGKISNVPETLALNDDTLLEQTQFTSSRPEGDQADSRLSHLDPSSQPALHPLDQCILLSLCLNVRNTSPSHGLTAEQMSPYVARVITHPLNWSVHTMALLLRSRLESARTRTVERATLQMQALVDQMPTADSSITERLQYLHGLPLPSKWELESELALQFLRLGVVRSALEIFERLEMWEEVVKCWGALERPDKGIAIVRDLLEGRREESENVVSRGKTEVSASRRSQLDAAREAKLWCLLGDLEPEHAAEHYQRAWTISRETSGRAMRSLGGYHFARGNFQEAITCLRRAVKINPLLGRTWFLLGCACVREEDWESARDAFSRCVSIDDEDGESWNNLASVYLRMQSTRAAGPKDDERAPNEADGDDDDEVSPSFLSFFFSFPRAWHRVASPIATC
ncbi:hypothetical protein HGRIS_010324 [Hohenbuehelia grisea]|uniref:Tetratricopeptide repeat domain 27 n=1 Tax=Hohenbuehelia grisea TaxID=104357 RepID=A0ABR3J3Z3_9AGAR